MISRINQRTCRAQGWDNAVPDCEGTISSLFFFCLFVCLFDFS